MHPIYSALGAGLHGSSAGALATSSSPLSLSLCFLFILSGIVVAKTQPFPILQVLDQPLDQKLLALAAAVLYKVAFLYYVCGLQAVNSLHSRHAEARGSFRSQFFAFNIGDSASISDPLQLLCVLNSV